MVEYLAGSILLAILGIALVIAVASVVLPRARARQLAARKRRELGSEQDLEAFIRRVDQVTAADELDHLDGKEEESWCSTSR